MKLSFAVLFKATVMVCSVAEAYYLPVDEVTNSTQGNLEAAALAHEHAAAEYDMAAQDYENAAQPQSSNLRPSTTTILSGRTSL